MEFIFNFICFTLGVNPLVSFMIYVSMMVSIFFIVGSFIWRKLDNRFNLKRYLPKLPVYEQKPEDKIAAPLYIIVWLLTMLVIQGFVKMKC